MGEGRACLGSSSLFMANIWHPSSSFSLLTFLSVYHVLGTLVRSVNRYRTHDMAGSVLRTYIIYSSP